MEASRDLRPIAAFYPTSHGRRRNTLGMRPAIRLRSETLPAAGSDQDRSGQDDAVPGLGVGEIATLLQQHAQPGGRRGVTSLGGELHAGRIRISLGDPVGSQDGRASSGYARLTHRCNVLGCTLNSSATCLIASGRPPTSSRTSRTIRTARCRNSSGHFLDADMIDIQIRERRPPRLKASGTTRLSPRSSW